jgi:hypothetical protein
MKIGFTGTREQLTEIQRRRLSLALSAFLETAYEFHHGDCIGADATAHQLALEYDYQVIIHPPTKSDLRAWCSGEGVWFRTPKNYISRNQKIVDETDILFATPYQKEEQPRGGTWSTIRYAKSKGKRVLIIFPDGTVDHING